MEINVVIPTGGTALDALITAADTDSRFNFNSTYFGNIGYCVNAIAGTANSPTCAWDFYYTIPGIAEASSPLGFSSVVIPGNNWKITLRYEKA